MAGNLTGQVRNIADVTKAVANGDLSKKITVDVKGEILELKNTINTMVDQLGSFASEVTRVAREVGTEGILGGQARVQGVSGTWKDLTDSVNFMAGNLTSQVRGIAKVVTAVANGDLKRKLNVEAMGEIAALSDTINSMIDTLATFADQVTTVAREVGVEGKLGGQAKVPGAAGTWKGLTENVNQLAANLTTQVRAIAEVATAVTQGDLTRSITVEAQGEVAALKDTINEMIRNLRDTTQKNTEQDWLKTNLAKFSRMLQGQKDLNTVGRLILSELAPVVRAQHAVFYVLDSMKEAQRLTLLASYAAQGQNRTRKNIELGEGLVGQCALEKDKIVLYNVPDDHVRISSGLGDSLPQSILILPVIFEGQVRGILELASLEGFNSSHQAFLDQLTESIGIVINTIEANMRTEDLLKQSQSLAQELQSRQQELQQTNQELQEKARLLVHQNEEVERKNQEVEQARQALEEKAEQLALTSKYKSEFLANMSHELRTPLNSLLILSDQLCKNTEGNLNVKQTGFAKTIHSSGNELLMLINDILDLSKIESGTVVVDPSEVEFDELQQYVERTFRHVAEAKNLDFVTRLDPGLPASMLTDSKRLQQIIKNLLSNAFKFTQSGQVKLTIEAVQSGWNPEHEDLNRAGNVMAFSVSDTGIGISADKQQIIFEAFQQADGSTSRKYGGTGLGLAISRELSRLLGGEIRLASTPARGSTFTLYLPQTYSPVRTLRKPNPSASTYHNGADAVAASAAFQRESAIGRAPESHGDGMQQIAGSVNVMPEVHITPAVASAAPEMFRPIDEVGDDRASIRQNDRVLLIVENDLAFARFLLDAAREKGFKGIVTSLGASALALATEYKPSAITLDIYLPDLDGWRVLDRIKNDLTSRHIPVCVISTDDSRERALATGALAFLSKPVHSKDILDAFLARLHDYITRQFKSVLVVEPKEESRERTVQYLKAEDIQITSVADGASALQMLRERLIDCIIVNPEASGLAALMQSSQSESLVSNLPIITYSELTEHDRDGGESGSLHISSGGSVIRPIHSRERLLDQVSLFLHRKLEKLPEAQYKVLDTLYHSTDILAGRNVLIVDDDMRNIFALSSVLEEQGMNVVSADNGRDAIRLLSEKSPVDIVLMDIMMPEMDGIDTMLEIRKLPHRKDLPIVAVTAKAMKGDREKCMEAGAWDYLSKPVDTDTLLTVLRSWLHR
jgi:signal transduction histidine kinase/DNA-binding response OmpR family regulator/HAMP domain-containing protein